MTRYRQVPDIVVLPAREAHETRTRSPVRIFLGTEDGQWRAERIFFYSIEQVRDPARTYEIHLMKNLDGFDRDGWRTGFTNYRFAVPEFSGFEGKAIYNDVDQIYLSDPAELFDLDMDGHGYLSVSPEDTSVMLVDCARMGRWWTHAKAAGSGKAELLRVLSTEPGIRGRLDDCWNARDMEFVNGDSKVLHFTTLHTQPWQPFPEDYSYHPNPLGEVWQRLEKRADAQGYQIFGADRPSPQLAAVLQRRGNPGLSMNASFREFLSSLKARKILTTVIGNESPMPAPSDGELDVVSCRVDHLAADTTRFDAVVAVNTLEQCPAEDVPWILEKMFARAFRAVCVAVECSGASNREADVDVTRTIRPLRWWRQQMAFTARRYPRVAWQLDVRGGARGATTLRAEGLRERPPSVWLLEGLRTGDNVQLHRLAERLERLGWPVDRKQLTFNKLHVLPNLLLAASVVNLRAPCRASLAPPWPDIVIGFGKRSTSVARWIKRQSAGRTRLVHLGRPWTRLDAFDLIVTTPQYRLPARENIHHNLLPLTAVTAEGLEERRRNMKDGFADMKRPLITVLVGGSSWSFAFDPRSASRLAQTASRRARELGGSLLVTTSPRTGRRSAEALFAAIDAPCRIHRFDAAGKYNPYIDYLAMADEVLVTGDSASMVADAVVTGRRVSLFPLPRRLFARLSTVVGKTLGRFRSTTYRGTPKQQGALGRFYDALVERGLVTPARDLDYLHQLLMQHGLVQPVAGAGPPTSPAPHDELDDTVKRITALFNEGKSP